MRKQFKFKPSKLDEFHTLTVFFFESIYFQSLTNDIAWHDNFIHSKLKSIYNKCKKLRLLLSAVHSQYILCSPNEKKLIYFSAINSNDIAGICNTSVNISHREDFNDGIGNAIHNLFHYIYYELPKTKIFQIIYGKLITHYEDLKKNNPKIKMCPFCGLSPIKPLASSTRQTYDHYLPLSKYPFVGLNTKNLVPTCKECNEDYKKDKDILYRDQFRNNKRRLLFPYGSINFNVKIEVKIFNYNKANLKVNQCVVNVGNEENILFGEMLSWKEIYDIENRYKNIINNDSDAWYDEYLEFSSQKQIDGTYTTNSDAFVDYINAIKQQESTTNAILKRPYFLELDNLSNTFK